MSSGQTPAGQLAALDARIHIYEGLVQVLDNLPQFIDVAVAGADPAATVKDLRRTFGFSEVQAMAAIDLQMRRLGKTDQSRLRGELDGMRVEREYLFGSLN